MLGTRQATCDHSLTLSIFPPSFSRLKTSLSYPGCYEQHGYEASLKLTVPFIKFEEEAAQLPFHPPVWGGSLCHHPVSVQPDTVGLGIDVQALL